MKKSFLALNYFVCIFVYAWLKFFVTKIYLKWMTSIYFLFQIIRTV